MRLTILRGCCGGLGRASGKSASRSGLISSSCTSKTGNNAAITGSIVLLLIWSFVGNCWGKAFHSGGQAEIEEDTTQGSLKEKFPPGASLGSSSVTGGARSPLIDDALLEGDDGGDEEDNEEDVIMGSVGGLVPLQDDSSQHWGDYKNHRHMNNHPIGNSNYGAAVHKRSLGRSYSFDGDGGDDEYQNGFQRTTRDNSRPVFYEKSGLSPSAGGSDSVTGNPNIRQKLMHLRNQYGDRWLAFMGPYAYRKRQILYRQCFFNPISCF